MKLVDGYSAGTSVKKGIVSALLSLLPAVAAIGNAAAAAEELLAEQLRELGCGDDGDLPRHLGQALDRLDQAAQLRDGEIGAAALHTLGLWRYAWA